MLHIWIRDHQTHTKAIFRISLSVAIAIKHYFNQRWFWFWTNQIITFSIKICILKGENNSNVTLKWIKNPGENQNCWLYLLKQHLFEFIAKHASDSNTSFTECIKGVGGANLWLVASWVMQFFCTNFIKHNKKNK